MSPNWSLPLKFSNHIFVFFLHVQPLSPFLIQCTVKLIRFINEAWGFYGSEDWICGFQGCYAVWTVRPPPSEESTILRNLKMETARSSETVVPNHHTTRRLNPENHEFLKLINMFVLPIPINEVQIAESMSTTSAGCADSVTVTLLGSRHGTLNPISVFFLRHLW